MIRARAVRITGRGGPEVLTLAEIEVRDPGPGEVLVEVAAAGLNRADTLQRRGLYPAPAGAVADVPGLEYAGRVAALGPGVSAVAVGDEVMGITGGGAMATHLLAHEREVMPAPDGLPLEQAAAVPEVFMTAYDALVRQAGLGIGDLVLIHAVASGVGTAALQLVRAASARAIGTSRTRAKIDRCRDLGLEHGIVPDRGAFADAAKSAFGRPPDIILDTIGAAYLAENARAVAPRGRIIVVGLLGGATGELPVGALLRKRASITGTVLRSRPLEDKATLAQEFSRRVVPLFSSGALAPVIDEVMPMEQIGEAHARMERNETFGKLVLSWSA